MNNDAVLRDRHVLLVEDEMMICMMIEDMLAGFGCKIVGPANNLEQALKLAAGQPIDTAVLDSNLDGERSFPVAEVLKRRGIPFIFASGYGTDDFAAQEGTPVLTKPFQESDLARALAESLRPAT